MPTCLVCSYPHLSEPPRSKSGGGSYEICPSCGFQFGVDDDDRRISYESARKAWIQKGCPWFSKSQSAPPDWKPAPSSPSTPPSPKTPPPKNKR